MNKNKTVEVEESVDINAVNEDSVLVDESEYTEYLYNNLIAETADFDNMISGLVTVEEGAGEVIKNIIGKIKELIGRFIKFLARVFKSIKEKISSLINKKANKKKADDFAAKMDKAEEKYQKAKKENSAANKELKDTLENYFESTAKAAQMFMNSCSEYADNFKKNQEYEAKSKKDWDEIDSKMNKLKNMKESVEAIQESSSNGSYELYMIRDNSTMNSAVMLKWFNDTSVFIEKTVDELLSNDMIRNHSSHTKSLADSINRSFENMTSFSIIDYRKPSIVTIPIDINSPNYQAAADKICAVLDGVSDKLEKVLNCVEDLDKSKTRLDRCFAKLSSSNIKYDSDEAKANMGKMAEAISESIKSISGTMNLMYSYAKQLANINKVNSSNVRSCPIF